MLKEVIQRERKLYRPETLIYINKGKALEEVINKGKIKPFISLILDWSNRQQFVQNNSNSVFSDYSLE